MSFKIVRRQQQVSEHTLPKALHPVLRRVFANRGIGNAAHIACDLKDLPEFGALKGMDNAIALLLHALDEQWRILVVADFDADGATSCATAVRGLRLLGYEHVDFLVPNRFEFGYGLTPEIVEVATRDQPHLIITVDNGIASIDGIESAKNYGIKVLVTDHHLPGRQLPDADAIVNPNQPGDGFPSKNLAGVGVIFYVLLALRAALRERGDFKRRAEPNLGRLLDLIALGTVADVVPLDHCNRILVRHGLQRIRQGKACAGIQALLKVAGRDYSEVTSSDLGFSVGPRLNAAGRLDDMALGIACLLSDDWRQAFHLASRLDGLNTQRRLVEQEMKAQAQAYLEKISFQDHDAPAGVTLYDPEWHQGVVGLLASRIKDQLNRPIIVFAQADDGSLKGSGRSIAGIHIRDVLAKIATQQPGIITKFGGHAMAAGLSINENRLDDFSDAFNDAVLAFSSEVSFEKTILSDGILAADEMGLPLAEQIRSAGPWGQGCPEPIFDGEFEIVSRSVLRDTHLKYAVRQNGGEPIPALYFNCQPEWLTREPSQLRFAYQLDVNAFRGQRKAQLLIRGIAE